jgi:hypothetical protein
MTKNNTAPTTVFKSTTLPQKEKRVRYNGTLSRSSSGTFETLDDSITRQKKQADRKEAHRKILEEQHNMPVPLKRVKGKVCEPTSDSRIFITQEEADNMYNQDVNKTAIDCDDDDNVSYISVRDAQPSETQFNELQNQLRIGRARSLLLKPGINDFINNMNNMGMTNSEQKDHIEDVLRTYMNDSNNPSVEKLNYLYTILDEKEDDDEEGGDYGGSALLSVYGVKQNRKTQSKRKGKQNRKTQSKRKGKRNTKKNAKRKAKGNTKKRR